MEAWLNSPVGPFTVGELGISFVIVLVTLGLRTFLSQVVFASLHRLTQKTKSNYDDRLIRALDQPTKQAVLVIGLFLAITVLPLESEWAAIVETLFRGLSMVIAFWALIRVVDVFIDVAMLVAGDTSALEGFAPLVKKSTRVFLIIVGAVMVIDNLGYNIGGILATLGIGGAAFAFAAKDTIANLYGSVALALDRPFKVGDWIQVGDVVDGDVESIGLRSTRVRTWPKTVISIPNHVLANEMINNYSMMPKRRVKQYVGVTYETPPATVLQIVEDIRQLLREDEGVQQDFILVNWTDFGDSALTILVYYFTTTTKWLEHMDIRQRINAKITQAILDRGSSIAYPTRMLHLSDDAQKALTKGQPLPGDHGPQEPV